MEEKKSKVKKRTQQVFQRIYRTLGYGATRFPESLGATYIFGIFVMIMNHFHLDMEGRIGRCMLLIFLMIFLYADVALLKERFGKSKSIRIILDIVVTLGAVIAYFLLPEELDTVFSIRYGAVIFVSIIGFLLIPYLGKKENVQIHVLQIFLSFFITYLYTLVLFLGVMAILFTINFLFDVNIPNEISLDIFVVTNVMFGLTYFLGKVPKKGKIYQEKEYPNVLRIIFVNIVTPLLVVYTFILYAYFIQMLVLFTWPDGLVGHLVIWYLLISSLHYFVIQPLENVQSWVKIYLRVYPFLMILPILMAGISMSIRIQTYGITISRYLGIVALIWLSIVAINGSIKEIKDKFLLSVQTLVSIFAVFILVSFFGPWSGFSLTIISQSERLEKMLTENDMLIEDAIVKNAMLSEKTQYEISELLGLLEKYRGLQLLSYIEDDFTTNDMLATFGFEKTYYYSEKEEKTIHINYYAEEKRILAITEYDWCIKIDGYDTKDIAVDFKNGDTYTFTKKEIKQHKAEKVEKVLVEKIAEDLYRSSAIEKAETAKEPLVYKTTIGNRKVMIIIESLHATLQDEVFTLRQISYEIFIKER